MKSYEYLSKRSKYLDERIDLSAGTKGWNTKSKEKAKEISGFINATVGSARNNDGSLLIFPTLLEEFGNLSGEKIFAYANIRGMHNFAQIWKEDTLSSFPSDLVDKTDRMTTQPLATCGLSGGLTLAGEAFLNKEDSLLIPNSRWGNIDNIFLKNQQLKEVNFKLLNNKGELDFSDLAEKIKTCDKEGKKFGIYLNFQNNPTGISPTFDQVKILQEALQELTTPAIIFLDDAYEGYVYETDVLKHSIFPYLVGLNEKVLIAKIDGVSKRYCAYGARLGAVTIGFGYEASVKEQTTIREVLAKITRSSVSNAPRGIQEAIVNVLTDGPKLLKIQQERHIVYDILFKRYNIMKRIATEREGKLLEPVDFNSGFFSYFLLKNNQSATDVSKKLLSKGLGTVPFENPSNGLNGIRVAFCSIKDDDIERAVDILYSTI